MVFIRPTILRSQADREATAARRYGIIREAQRQFNPKVEPSIDQLVIDYLGAVPPALPAQPGDVTIAPAPVVAPPGGT
jgi:general secretion pathway protein D